MAGLRPIELFLIEFIFYLALWLWNDYVATLVSSVFAVIFLFLLVISYIVEWIEPSKVPTWYYRFMLVSILAPVIAAVLFIGLYGTDLEWLGFN